MWLVGTPDALLILDLPLSSKASPRKIFAALPLKQDFRQNISSVVEAKRRGN
jgi:hypothetical protein